MLRSARATLCRAALLAAGAALAASLAANADVQDLRVGVDGARAEIAIVFDAAPTGASAAPGGGGIVVFASGVAASPRRIETAGASLVRAVDVRAGEGGVELDLALGAEAAAARSWIDGRTLRIAVTLAAPWGTAAQPPSAPAPVAPSTSGATTAPMDGTAPVGAAVAANDAPAGTAAMTAGAETPAASPAAASAEPGAPPVQAAISPADAAAAAALTAPPPSTAVVAPGLRAGGETTPSAGSPEPSDGAAEAAQGPIEPRDLGRPSVIYAGAVTEEECDAADATVRADPWDLVALKRYASCRALDGDPAGAETAFRRLLTFTPDDADAELGLATVRHEQGAVEEAAAVYERLLLDATGDAEGARLRALLALAAAGQ